MTNILRIICLLVLAGGPLAANLARPANPAQANQDVQVIEVTAKKYEYSPAPIRVKQGSKVQLKITSLDRTHGFKINLYPDGAEQKGDPGLVFSSAEDCFKIETGAPTVVEFVARTAGTYSFHCCNRCGLGHGGMKGQLVVEPCFRNALINKHYQEHASLHPSVPLRQVFSVVTSVSAA
jgi:cytochrome c oxidase subunit II